MKNLANVIIYIAGLLWTIETLPQIYKLWKTKQSEDISLTFFIICVSGYALFIIGNVILKQWSVVIANAFPLINLCIINILIIKYRGKK